MSLKYLVKKIIKFFFYPFVKLLTNRFAALRNEIAELRVENQSLRALVDELRSWNADRMNEIANLQKAYDELRRWNSDRMNEIRMLQSLNGERMNEINDLKNRYDKINAASDLEERIATLESLLYQNEIFAEMFEQTKKRDLDFLIKEKRNSFKEGAEI